MNVLSTSSDNYCYIYFSIEKRNYRIKHPLSKKFNSNFHPENVPQNKKNP